MTRITFCIPSKNNLRYLKTAITSIRHNSVTNPDIIVYVDADNDGTVEWLIDNNITFLRNDTIEPRGIAYGYNRCIEAANTDIVCMFHADMYMAPGFDTAILAHMKPGAVVAGTRIEPPLHPPGNEKIVHNFGLYPEDFNEREFLSFVNRLTTDNRNKTTRGIFAPWAVYKSDITRLGLHDENFHSFHEDSDIFNRFVLGGFEIVQTWEAYVYHLTCRGGQFQDGVERITDDQKFHDMKRRSAAEFVRKWGQFIQNDEYHYPIIYPTYKKTLVLKHTSLSNLGALEPWFDEVIVDDATIQQIYVSGEQHNTQRDLKTTVLYNTPPTHGIVVTVDGNTLTRTDYQAVTTLNNLIDDVASDDVGTYEIGNLVVEIHSFETRTIQ